MILERLQKNESRRVYADLFLQFAGVLALAVVLGYSWSTAPALAD